MTDPKLGSGAPMAALVCGGIAAVAAGASAFFGGPWLAGLASFCALVAVGACFGVLRQLTAAKQESMALLEDAKRLARGEGDTLEAGAYALSDAINARLAQERSAAERQNERLEELDEALSRQAGNIEALDAACAQMVIDADGIVREANAMAVELFGTTEDTVIGADVTSLFEDRAGWASASVGGSFSFLRTTVGGWVSGNVATSAESTVVVLRDASDERKAVDSAALGKATIENAPQPMAVIDDGGRVQSVNAALRALMDANPGAAAQWPAFAAGEGIVAFSSSEETVTCDEQVFTVSVQTIEADSDTPRAQLVSVTDVTEASAKRTVLDAVDAEACVVSIAADGTIERVSDAFAAAVGQDKDGLVGQSIGETCQSQEGQTPWSKTAADDHRTGCFAWTGRGGTTIWIKGSFTEQQGRTEERTQTIFVGADVTGIVADARDHKRTVDSVGSTQAMIWFDLEGAVVASNAQAQSIMGWATEAPATWRHGQGTDDSAEASQAFASAVAGNGKSGTFQLSTSAGAEHHLHGSYTPVSGTDGRLEAVLFCGVPAETTAANGSASVAAQAFVQQPSATIIVDRAGEVMLANGAAEAFFAEYAEQFSNVDARQLEGATIASFIDEADSLLASGFNGEDQTSETVFTRGDLKFSATITRVYDETGTQTAAAIQWAEVSEQLISAMLGRSFSETQALIHFRPDGTIIKANDNFLATMGYAEEEIIGKHHRMFVDFSSTTDEEYADLWSRLNRGEIVTGRAMKRVTKAGEHVYLRASYTPIRDDSGEVIRVFKAAVDATEEETQRLAEVEERSQQQAVQSTVVEQLASGLKQLADGDYTVQLTDHFPVDYMQLRYDFNDAVTALQAADSARQKASDDQSSVVERLALALNRLSDGVLTFQLEDQFPAEYEQLRADFNVAIERVRDVIGSIKSTAKGIKTGASEISQAADDLSKRTENQAATLEETAAALDEITVTVRQTAEGATEVNRVASETRDEAKVSGDVVGNAVEAMDEIERSSTQISQIIGVIDDIAFQTNLLALNAGVEAARAGDAGRGFAVVAQEVRALAQRSSEAAKEIKTLISTSSEQVSRGVELVDKAGSALGDIVTRVENVSALVSEIAASAQEQSVSLAEVNAAMNKMDQVTQQNASMVEQSTASSHSLAKASGMLIDRVAHFETGESEPLGAESDEFFSPGDIEPEIDEPPVRQQRDAAQAFFAGVGGAAEKLENQDENWEEF
ncbi:MAG: methyl-accepting chemotaxis protein [Pseudomonadota bacterium]